VVRQELVDPRRGVRLHADEDVGKVDDGVHARSRRDLDRFIEKCATHAAVQVASVFAWRGEMEHAFVWIDRARAQRDPGLPDITVDPLLPEGTRRRAV
jgi:hypothetical protein